MHIDHENKRTQKKSIQTYKTSAHMVTVHPTQLQVSTCSPSKPMQSPDKCPHAHCPSPHSHKNPHAHCPSPHSYQTSVYMLTIQAHTVTSVHMLTVQAHTVKRKVSTCSPLKPTQSPDECPLTHRPRSQSPDKRPPTHHPSPHSH